MILKLIIVKLVLHGAGYLGLTARARSETYINMHVMGHGEAIGTGLESLG